MIAKLSILFSSCTQNSMISFNCDAVPVAKKSIGLATLEPTCSLDNNVLVLSAERVGTCNLFFEISCFY